jgi:hypothetical protein
MADCMTFPKTADEFIEQYSFKDEKQEYTNGAELIPAFRVKQMMEHYFHVEVVRCKECKWAEYGKDYEPYCNHWKSGLYANIKDDDFCSYGERKDDAKE